MSQAYLERVVTGLGGEVVWRVVTGLGAEVAWGWSQGGQL